MKKKHYCERVYDHFKDNQIYKKTNSNCDSKVMNKIKILTQKYQNNFNQAPNRLPNKFFSFNKQFL